MAVTDPGELLDLLAARSGIVCTVGAGGKKTTLYRLAEAHRALGTPRIALTTTVLSAPPPRELAGQGRLIAPADELRAAVPARAGRHGLLLYATPSPKPGRLGGPPPALITELHTAAGFTVTLVKADGARMRLIKAPNPDEPVLPPGVATVLPLVSAAAIGRPLDAAIAHRPERVAAVTGAAPGERLTPDHVARLLASAAGALQGTGTAMVVPVINMVDDAGRHRLAAAAARAALALSTRFTRVVLARMSAPEPVVEVISG